MSGDDLQPAADQVAMRRGAETRAKGARERIAVESAYDFEVLGGGGELGRVKLFADAIQPGSR